MAVKMRLKRLGSKKNPFYRIVIADARAPRDGRFIEEIGYYNPLTKDLKLDNEKAADWVKKGVQPTETVRSLLKKSGAIE
jgi:small subunit ribosomal protein S16